MASMTSEQIVNMERAIAALALELPGEVWGDVRDRWHAARDSFSTQLARVQEAVDLLTDEQLSPSGRMLLEVALWCSHWPVIRHRRENTTRAVGHGEHRH